jgi:hypothetical protein
MPPAAFKAWATSSPHPLQLPAQKIKFTVPLQNNILQLHDTLPYLFHKDLSSDIAIEPFIKKFYDDNNYLSYNY